ncbi:MAG: B12-binding domain-containing radical SAM protein [Candidatus Hydrogenedentes bacterium]|nr:B12-binding domain-containing radical SAM protein [Candidatus Hydrogenedentota bacterium]
MGHTVLLYPHTGRNRSQDNILPLSVLYVASPVVHAGHTVTCIDQRMEPDWRAKLRRAVSEPRTLCVGISSMTGPQITHGIELAQAVREMAPGLPIVWGGVHPSLLPEQTAASPYVDIVAAGEGEACFPALVDALDQGKDWRQLPGIFYKENGGVRGNPFPPVPDIESIPPLPYELFDLEKYKISPLRTAGPSLPMVTSRGCRFRCAYCYIAQFQRRKWRGISPERVIAEMKRLQTEYNAEGVFLLDDLFFQERARAHRIMELLIENDVHINIYNANCRIDFLFRIPMEYLHMVRRAGIKQLFIGTESGSPQVLKDMMKDITVDQVLVANQKLRDADIVPVYSFMAGIPGETPSDVEMTLDLMIRLKEENPKAKLYKMCLFVPFPGTEYFDRVKQMGNRFPEKLEDWGTFDYDHVNLSYLTDDFRKYLAKVSELSGFVDVDGKMSGMLAPFVHLYSKIAVMRCKKRQFNWMPEMAAIRLARAWQRV